MYQEFFQLQAMPFNLTPNPNFFCQLKGHQDALETLLFCIQSGEGFIKIVGEVGAGKTLLCRKLLESLDSNYVTAYIPNPDLTPLELRKAFARELSLDPNAWQGQHELLTAINQHLIELFANNKKVVLLVDEAQALSDESLETIRLLTNLETENAKLLQVVLFGQPELDERLNLSRFRQLKQRITFAYTLPLMNKKDLDVYLHHRLAVAGFTHGHLFTKRARALLYRASRGIPRLVNILSHKSLLVAYGRGDKRINHKTVQVAIVDTQACKQPIPWQSLFNSVFATTMIILLAYGAYLTGSLM
ncbi:MAG: AAA family ATPase [Gammaproteobacteria bacterium]|nr:AAA family ATPase [Gammaproteobacteria bacterium]